MHMAAITPVLDHSRQVLTGQDLHILQSVLPLVTALSTALHSTLSSIKCRSGSRGQSRLAYATWLSPVEHPGVARVWLHVSCHRSGAVFSGTCSRLPGFSAKPFQTLWSGSRHQDMQTRDARDISWPGKKWRTAGANQVRALSHLQETEDKNSRSEVTVSTQLDMSVSPWHCFPHVFLNHKRELSWGCILKSL